MEILNLSLPATNRFATEYLEQTDDIQRFFHYRYNDHSEYESRVRELQEHSYMRMEMANYIEEFMANYPTSDHVHHSIEKFKQENSAVIIGGQQAGILTGPLYTIHKVISIITLAKQKEKELNIPVVPIFWIAGEDHDYQEVNHVFIEKDNKIEKKIYPERVLDKRMVSDIPINQDLCIQWTEAIIQSFGETIHTKPLLHELQKAVHHSNSFVDFFAYIIMYLFKDSGLLIIDSGDGNIRKLEKEFFIKQINSSVEITKAVKSKQSELQDKGFPNTIDISSQAANLFYYDMENNERILLEFDEHKNVFIDSNSRFQFSLEQMLELAGEFPEKLSNNVVTRPLMQEWLFPTLAFIAGPGEIAYWAELKGAFELFGLKMPPIVPRLNITILDRSIETDMNELGLDLHETLTIGTEKKKREFLQSLKDENIESLFEKAKKDLLQNYGELETYLSKENKGLIPLLKKNESKLIEQLMFMEAKIEQTEQIKFEVVINKFDRVENALWPAGSPQERVLNGFYFINQYGPSLINDLLDCSFTFDGTQKLIRI
ncbi:bacillithiol biosynthesis cysteine-adding enzyme BshC [Cytobacillus eiseniae]|uniref:Putative cysteine ligase BshC n=1 Tax=Cytobacillus eiseniae TaxID=762947 RepID=A0ABS4RAV9_9BACI|nr:bacillithiol biosynthesis cysteine-adding enzyme BshC [Cytobacillus eiseniae]MBP2240025.1 bacillithiol biosynthesis cysteine-adding enzyme BshC [Cytobacillus eiseniae]